jgi:hypothetical protein
VQVNHYEVQRRQYQWWVYGTPWMNTVPTEFRSGSILRVVKTGYLALAAKLASRERDVEAMISDARNDQVRIAETRSLVRAHFAKPLKASSLLGANHRTITLGISMIAGSPLYHMVYQIVVLNVLLLLSLGVQRRAVARIVGAFTPTDQAQADTHRPSAGRNRAS